MTAVVQSAVRRRGRGSGSLRDVGIALNTADVCARQACCRPAQWRCPAQAPRPTQYGNMRTAQIIAILSAVRALCGTPYTDARHVQCKHGKYRDARYFVISGAGSHLRPGIYQRPAGHRVIPV